jgi:hypothetical protein
MVLYIENPERTHIYETPLLGPENEFRKIAGNKLSI